MERSEPRVHIEPTRCPYCREAIPRGEAPAVCPDCHALHHVECMQEHGRCATCSVAQVRAPAPRVLAEPAGPARIHWENLFVLLLLLVLPALLMLLLFGLPRV